MDSPDILHISLSPYCAARGSQELHIFKGHPIMSPKKRRKKKGKKEKSCKNTVEKRKKTKLIENRKGKK